MTTSTLNSESDKKPQGAANSELVDVAIDLLERGLPIVACVRKKPTFDGKYGALAWQKHKWTAADLHKALENNQFPAIGLQLGKEAGLIDIEADGPEEERLIAELFDGCEMPVTPTYQSRRGKHRLFRFDERLTQTKCGVINFKTENAILKSQADAKLGCRIGADGKGAQSVIPPSKDRTWLVSLDDCDPARLPDLVVERLIKAAPGSKPKPPKAKSSGDQSGAHADALAAMLRISAEDTADGSKRLFTVACRAVEHDLSDGLALATIHEYARQKPFPAPWSDADILQRIRDAEKIVERGTAIEIANFEVVEIEDENGELKDVIVPIKLPEIIDTIYKCRGNFPRRVDNVLFVDDPQHGIDWFDRRTTAGLFGWLRRHHDVNWKGGSRLASREEVFSELERTARKYVAIENTPHEPPMPRVYYRCTTPPVGNGDHLRKLLDRFRPSTTIDRDLIQAALMTVVWGGIPGARPAFVITSDAGRGAGKTVCAEMIASVVGGHLDVSAGEDIQTLKSRLLSPEGQSKRVALLDNVKTMRLSWAELESLITTPTISGKRMYVGEGQRPNTLTWLITLNGVSLATDMAQRAVIVKLDRGRNDGPWLEETHRYIQRHREQIIGDLIGALRAEPKRLARYSRWATWEKDILCRLPEPEEAQRVILERQGSVNCELDEAEIIQDFFAQRLRQHGYADQIAQLRIPVGMAAVWFCEAMNERMKVPSVSKRLKQMHLEGQLPRISPDTSRTYGRCFIWTGINANVMNENIDNSLLTNEAFC